MSAPQYLSMFTIYAHPKDYPDKFVVREFVIKPTGAEPSQYADVYDTLDDAREPLIRRGLVCLTRQPGDEPQIVETWL